MALAALENMFITGLDVKSAYLYGTLEEEIYMEQPEGFKVIGQENKVLKLKKALYGLKQAGLAWWKTLNKSLIDLGFKHLTNDAGLFLHENGEEKVIAIIYVDDTLFCRKNKKYVNKVKADFMKKWECRDLGEMKEFLHMNIESKDQIIKIDQ